MRVCCTEKPNAADVEAEKQQTHALAPKTHLFTGKLNKIDDDDDDDDDDDVKGVVVCEKALVKIPSPYIQQLCESPPKSPKNPSWFSGNSTLNERKTMFEMNPLATEP